MEVNFLHTEQEYRRGDLCLADLTGVTGSEQGGIRPALILSNDVGNRFSPIVTIAIISSQTNKKRLPTHVFLDAKRYNLERDSFGIDRTTENNRQVESDAEINNFRPTRYG